MSREQWAHSVDPTTTTVWEYFTAWRRAQLTTGHTDAMQTVLFAHRPTAAGSILFELHTSTGATQKLGNRSAATRTLRAAAAR